MTGQPEDLAGLQRRLVDFAAAREWQPFHTPKNLATALSVEASELLEIFQWLTPEQAAAVMADPESAHRVRDEVADVLAYLLQFCWVVEVDPLTALADKIDRNEKRFPRPSDTAEPSSAEPSRAEPSPSEVGRGSYPQVPPRHPCGPVTFCHAESCRQAVQGSPPPEDRGGRPWTRHGWLRSRSG